MTAILKVDTIQDTAGNNIINESSDTITIGAAGDTVTVPGTEVKSNKLSPASGTALQIGDSGDTITIPSGATITNSGTASGFGGITNAQQWRVTTTFTGNADPITANWEEADTYGYGRLGTIMSLSSGVFTFPSTGFWYIQLTVTHIEGSSELQYGVAKINATTNNSSYNDIAVSYNSVKVDGGYQTTTASAVMDITNTSTHKVSLSSNSNHSSTSTMGDSNLNRTYVTFIRLGDT